MIIFYSNTAEGVLLKSVVSSLSSCGDDVTVGCGDAVTLSLAVMKAMMDTKPTQRVDLVFLGITPDKATETWIESMADLVRSVNVIGRRQYVPMAKCFRALVRLNNQTGDVSYGEQLTSMFTDETAVRRELNRVSTLTQQIVKKEAACG